MLTDEAKLSDETSRLIAFTRVLAVSVLCCLGFSWKLWLSRPLYPMVPVIDFLGAFPHPLDYAVLGLLAAALIGLVARPRSKLCIAFVLAMFTLLFLQDQNRLWPSFYQFFFSLLLLASYRRDAGESDAHRVLSGLRFVVAAVYFWGGVHKLNTHFFHEEFPWFLEPLTDRLPLALPALPKLAVVAASFEVLVGVGLLTRRFRTIALYGALLMHLLIGVCIGPLRDNFNNSAWVWSLTVAVQTWILFARAPAFGIRAMFGASSQFNVPQALSVVFIGVLPVLNSFNRWDSALSFNVYSGNVHYAEIHLPPRDVKHLPDELLDFLTIDSRAAVLNVNHWALSEFNANAYPETRVYKAVFSQICSYLPDNSATLYVREKSGWFFPKTTRRYDCAEE